MSNNKSDESYIVTLWFFGISLLFSGLIYLLYKAFQYKYQQSKSIKVINILKFLQILSLTLLWYSISISFTVYNKWLMKSYRGGFDFPITITSVHMFMKFIFSRIWALITLYDSYPPPPIKSSIYVNIVIPIGLTTAFDIALSNTSVSLLSISLFTIIKTTVVIWTFVWGCMLTVETYSHSKLSVILLLIIGLSLAVSSNILVVSITGIITALSAASCGGLRWVLVQLLIQQDNISNNPCITLYRFSLISLLTIIPLVIIFDIKTLINSIFFQNLTIFMELFQFCVLGGLIGCALIVVEIYLLNLTSSLTLSILGELKEIIQIIFTIITFHDSYNILTIIGTIITLLSAELYRQIKHSELILIDILPMDSINDNKVIDRDEYDVIREDDLFIPKNDDLIQ